MRKTEHYLFMLDSGKFSFLLKIKKVFNITVAKDYLFLNTLPN